MKSHRLVAATVTALIAMIFATMSAGSFAVQDFTDINGEHQENSKGKETAQKGGRKREILTTPQNRREQARFYHLYGYSAPNIPQKDADKYRAEALKVLREERRKLEENIREKGGETPEGKNVYV